MARNTINVGVDTERFALALEVIAKHATACAADLRALTDLPAAVAVRHADAEVETEPGRDVQG